MHWIRKFWIEIPAWLKILPIGIALVILFIGSLTVLYWYFVGIKLNPIDINNATDLRDFFVSIAAIASISFTIWRMIIIYRQADMTHRQTDITHPQTDVQQQSVHTENYFKAVDNLKDENISIRTAAIYELGKIAGTSKDHHLQIVELLCSYIRENATEDESKKQDNHDLAIDIQAALDVLGRRSAKWIKEIERPKKFRMNLNGIHIKKANLVELNFKDANLMEAHLEDANLITAHLEGAYLRRAHLERAYPIKANLEGADLEAAHLEGANLMEANLKGANLWHARLKGAVLSRAQLEGADLKGAHLESAILWQADLEGVKNLEQAQIDSAFGDKATKIPQYLDRPTHWLDRTLDLHEIITESKEWKRDPKNYQPPKK